MSKLREVVLQEFNETDSIQSRSTCQKQLDLLDTASPETLKLLDVLYEITEDENDDPIIMLQQTINVFQKVVDEIKFSNRLEKIVSE